MRLGEKIYTLRTGKNLSQGDLADALAAATVLRFRNLPMALSKKNVLLTVICWVLFVISILPIPIPITAPEMIWRFNLLLSAIGWIKNILFVAALTFTARLITTYRNSRKNGI